MDVYILCALLTESFAVCGSRREHFLEHPWQHWQFCMSCPWSPSGVKAFTGDISTPLRHGHDIPEGCPRAVKLLHLLQLFLSFLLSCASTRFFVTVHHTMCVVSCKLQLKDAFDVLFVLFLPYWKKGDSVVSLTRGSSQLIITLVLWRSLALLLRDTGGAERGGWGAGGGDGTTYHARNRLTYIIHDRGYYPSQRPSVVARVALICSHPKPHRLPWPSPCSHTHKPELSTVSLAQDHTRLSLWRCDQSGQEPGPRCGAPIAYLQCDFSRRPLHGRGNAKSCLFIIQWTAFWTITGSRLNF